jgi:stage II sporulation protein AA (anti-sigma F factor antagonist)
MMYRIVDRNLIVKITKELDHHNAIDIREESDRILDENKLKNMIFDFSNTVFMDSSGIGLIMGRYKKLKVLGGKVAVTGVKPAVEKILILSGVYKLVEKYDTVEEACNKI